MFWFGIVIGLVIGCILTMIILYIVIVYPIKENEVWAEEYHGTKKEEKYNNES